MDFSKLTRSQRIVAIGGMLAVVNLFLPWYGGPGFSVSAFDSGTLAWGGSLLLVAAGLVIVLDALDVTTLRIAGVAPAQLGVVLAAGGLISILVRWISDHNWTTYGLYTGVILAVLVLYGAHTTMTEAGLSLPTLDDFRASRDD